jgi:hypothetical protein
MLTRLKTIFYGSDSPTPSGPIPNPVVNAPMIEKVNGYDFPVIHAKSPRAEPPAFCRVKFWDHQKAMLARCREIERNKRAATATVRNLLRYAAEEREAVAKQLNSVPIGVMMDPPGCGKTYVALALAADSAGPTLIIVPQNIFFQWKEAMTALLPEDFPYRCINTYESVNNLFKKMHDKTKATEPMFGNAKIVLINDAYAEPLAQTLHTMNEGVERVIVDEVDSVHTRLCTPIKCKHMWLVSASFEYNEYMSVGPYQIRKEDVPFVFCKCYSRFMDTSLGLENPVAEKYLCDDADVQLFAGILKEKTFRGYHAGDSKPVFLELGYSGSTDSLAGVAQKFVDDNGHWDTEMAEQSAKLEELKKREATIKDEEELLSIQAQILNTGFEVERIRPIIKKRETLKERLTTYTPPDPVKQKSAVFTNTILPQIKANPDQRWLICNDFFGSLAATFDILQAAGIKCAMLDGGNARKLQETLDGYKKGDTQVLLLNAKIETVGMNLENTTHLLFMHATRPEMVSQVVGRAHRYGRKGPLHILGLFNKGEEAFIMKE